MEKTSIQINDEFKAALDLLENTDSHAFITGKAGTGKSTLLGHFRDTTEKNVVVLAPTGVAALNVKGQTMHSFFRFRPDITLGKVRKLREKDVNRKLYKSIDVIVIDEVSMVRADLLDCVDKFLRLNGKKFGQPFGGVQMVFIGDLYQLSPVVTAQEREALAATYETPYFFSAKVFRDIGVEFVELESVYRQKDERFIGLLNAIRDNSVTEAELSILNERVESALPRPGADFLIHLTTTNKMAGTVNDRKLAELSNTMFTFTGSIDGKFEDKYLPTAKELQLKADSQVMFLTNDGAGRWVNGTIGKVVEIRTDRDYCVRFDEDDPPPGVVLVEVPEHGIVPVVPHTWDIFKYSISENSGHLAAEVVGSFTQFPIKLAWAVTIHKSQGKTFEKVIIDIGTGAFAHGQVYVALSRCTTLEGISLRRPVGRRDVLMDERVVAFLDKQRAGSLSSASAHTV